jgi:hypothetical protein
MTGWFRLRRGIREGEVYRFPDGWHGRVEKVDGTGLGALVHLADLEGRSDAARSCLTGDVIRRSKLVNPHPLLRNLLDALYARQPSLADFGIFLDALQDDLGEDVGDLRKLYETATDMSLDGDLRWVSYCTLAADVARIHDGIWWEE